MRPTSTTHKPPEKRSRKRRLAGFTLVELLVVVTLIGILALISLPRFSRTREKAYRSQMQTALRTLVTAQEAYFDKNYQYSADIAGLDQSVTPMVTLQIAEVGGNGWSADAMHQMTTITCGLYVGPVSPIAGVPDAGEGVITCSAS